MKKMMGDWVTRSEEGIHTEELDSGLVLGSDCPLSWCTEGRVLGRGPTTSQDLP